MQQSIKFLMYVAYTKPDNKNEKERLENLIERHVTTSVQVKKVESSQATATCTMVENPEELLQKFTDEHAQE